MSNYMNCYPSLRQLESQFLNDYLSDKLEVGSMIYNFKSYMFPQTWGDGRLGFNLNPNMLACQAITNEYTTVFNCVCYSERKDGRHIYIVNPRDFYCVCFGNEIAYVIESPNERLTTDLCHMRMRSQRDALKEYIGPNSKWIQPKVSQM